jgi:hypothetical protein
VPDGETGRATTFGELSQHERHRTDRLHETWRWLGRIGPFAGAFAVYGLLLDHLPDNWFTHEFLKYLLAALAAVCVAFALYLLGTTLTGDTPPDRFTPRRSSPSGSARALLAATARALTADFRRSTDPDDSAIQAGWSQYMSDPTVPTAIGTAYGLRLATALDLREPRINRRELVDSVIRLQRDGGGWAASTQRGIARPEVTAWVLSALCRVGMAPDDRRALVKRLEELVTGDDDTGKASTTVLATVLSALAEIAPDSVLVPGMVRQLIAGGINVDEPAGTVWGETLTSPRASVPHTARAVLSLHRILATGSAEPGVDAVLERGMAWLNRADIDLAPVDEQLRRRMPAGVDVDALVIGHFTAAWVARALMCGSNTPKIEYALRRAMREVLASQEDGIWTWHDGRQPLWMTYQGAVAVRDYTLLGLAWPP